MKKYIGTKEVSAEPMTLGRFTEQYRNPYRENDKHDAGEEGYLVEYKDGYRSWSPKNVFDEAYRPCETFLDRLRNELNNESGKLDKLKSFLKTDAFKDLSYKARVLLEVQANTMDEFVKILTNRIELVSEEDMENFGYDFGTALKLLKAGAIIRRVGWNGKNIYVFKQVPAEIDKNIVPKMTSLPQSAKDLILETAEHIDYTSQCLIYNVKTGRADSWIPSSSDVFAEDWEIVDPKEVSRD